MTADQRAARVRLAILDVDGVLTDGRLYYGPEGEALKAFDVRDGHGIKMLLARGIDVAILSARNSPIVARRARELGIGRVLQGRGDKAAAHWIAPCPGGHAAVRAFAEFILRAKGVDIAAMVNG